jgi:hypothetical protein
VPVAIIITKAKTLAEPVFAGDFLYIGTKTPPEVERNVFLKWLITFGIVFGHLFPEPPLVLSLSKKLYLLLKFILTTIFCVVKGDFRLRIPRPAWNNRPTGRRWYWKGAKREPTGQLLYG